LQPFSLIVTVLSMILGLGVTRLLLGLVSAFRARRQSPLHWLPVTWAGCLFLIQLEYWWAINQLPHLKAGFSFVDFLSLVILTLTLFVSAALLLPSRPEDEQQGILAYFEDDGRYALLAVSAFLVCGWLANIFLFHQSPLRAWGLLDIPLIVLPVVAFSIRSRKAHAWICAAYVPLLALDTWISLSA